MGRAVVRGRFVRREGAVGSACGEMGQKATYFARGRLRSEDLRQALVSVEERLNAGKPWSVVATVPPAPRLSSTTSASPSPSSRSFSSECGVRSACGPPPPRTRLRMVGRSRITEVRRGHLRLCKQQ